MLVLNGIMGLYNFSSFLSCDANYKICYFIVLNDVRILAGQPCNIVYITQ